MSTRWMLIPLPLCLAGVAGLVQAAPLTFSDALKVAEQQSPALTASAANLRSAQSAAIPAGALPDPKLIAGVENYPVSGDTRWALERDFMTMQKIGIMQEVPNGDKRRARVEVADARSVLAQKQQQVSQLDVRRGTALAWLDRYYLEKKLALFDQLDQENRLLADTVRAQVASGKSQPADAVMAEQEQADLADRRDGLTRDIAMAIASLRRYVGADADDPLPGDAPALAVDPERYRAHLHHHPEVELLAAKSGEARAELHEAQAEKKPDWGVELAYQRRGPQFGNMVSVQFTIGLPIFSKSRQDPMIASKAADLERADAERDAMLRDHLNELDNGLAEYTSLTRQLDRVNQTWLPLARRKVDLLTAGYRSGRTDMGTVLAARRDLIERRMKAIDLENQRAQIAAKLYFTYGGDEQ
ncbi:TolC family protein [Pandoraea sp. XJJ-1]|uniref:TolC family protein n=1 Tax=unclassified Pandoraea TaxID=2624094 RepID=UPI0003453E1E|nr:MULTISPECIES: TolC family protein [unclassified Pandoraea]WAL85016.1 TolC family protein [Pandoraea sp. XJJ-1]